jgi:hypothetical protein
MYGLGNGPGIRIGNLARVPRRNHALIDIGACQKVAAE